MARNLLKAGNRVVVCDRSPVAVAALKAAGASSAESPAELASTPGRKFASSYFFEARTWGIVLGK